MLEFTIYGLIHEGDWDLTQPQATLLAGVISGVLLIAAAYIAFHGQREQREAEREIHEEQMAEQRRRAAVDLEAQRIQLTEQLNAQRTQFLDDIEAKERIRLHELQRAAALLHRGEIFPLYSRALERRDALLDALSGVHMALEARNDGARVEYLRKIDVHLENLDGAAIELSASMSVTALDSAFIALCKDFVKTLTPPTNIPAPGWSPIEWTIRRKTALESARSAGRDLRNEMRAELDSLSKAGLPAN